MLEGIDNSVFNTADPNSTRLSFIFSRATYGGSVDRRYSQHAAFAKKAGLVQGAYAYGTRSAPLTTQVTAFLDTAKAANLLALDLEYNGADTMTNVQGSEFIARVHAQGRKIGLYHSASGYPRLGQDFDWVAQWGSTTPPAGWEFWQYTGGPLDHDRYSGSLSQLRTLAGLAALPKYEVVIHPEAGTRGYPTYRYFNEFSVSGSVITGSSVDRTGGFSATCTAPARFTWGTNPAQMLVRLTSGSRAGKWVRAAWADEVK